MTRVRILLIALLCASAFGQSSETAPTFLAADVRHSKSISVPSMMGPVISGDTYKVRYALLVELVRRAYGIVDRNMLTGGPPWMASGRYDIKAKIPAGSTPEQINLMLRSLLEERFKLVGKLGTAKAPGDILTAGKRPLLKPATGTEEFSGCRTGMPRPAEAGSDNRAQMVTVTCRNAGLDALPDLIRNLPRTSNSWILPRVVDRTGITGKWNFDIQYDLMQAHGDDNSFLVPIFERQLGLKLESTTLDVPFLEIASMSLDPTPNPPGLEKYFPPPPTEFEVAELKPSSAPDPRTRQISEIRNGRVILTGMPLSQLIRLAWDLDDTDVVGVPKALEGARFDLVAKMPDGVQVGSLSPLDLDTLRPMMQDVLVRKFKMKTHTEERPADAYVLKAVKPKLTPTAYPKDQAMWHTGPPYATTDKNTLNPALGRVVTGQNLTMAQFASLLPGMDPSAFPRPVRDATGLEGAYDFTINYERYAILAGRGGMMVYTPGGVMMTGRGAEQSSEPSGKISIIEAVSKQLGLKLELEKRPFPVMVIDSMEEKIVEE